MGSVVAHPDLWGGVLAELAIDSKYLVSFGYLRPWLFSVARQFMADLVEEGAIRKTTAKAKLSWNIESAVLRVCLVSGGNDQGAGG